MKNIKRGFCYLLCVALLLICTASAFAQTPSLSSNLLKYAKEALVALADGDYQKVVTLLPFSGISPSADEWRSLAEDGFSSLSGASPQTRYAVAYQIGNVWKIAVPIATPDNSSVETLVLLSEDGQSFSGYGCSNWKKVISELENSDYVSWNEEYNASTSVIVENDQ